MKEGGPVGIGPLNMLNMDEDEVIGDEDLILAGGPEGMPKDESAYAKMMEAGEGSYSG